MRIPSWLKTNTFRGVHTTKNLLRKHGLSTVCEEARCPNKGQCFSKPTATFLILGDICTRNCSFCSVTSGSPSPPDPDEPKRVALAAQEMELKYIVITSVTRDDLPDGGAKLFSLTIRSIRDSLPSARVEVLTPDFNGKVTSVQTVIHALPDVFNHNLETVPRLYEKVRPHADYKRSLFVLHKASELSKGVRVKSGIMVGLGETYDEVLEVMDDLLGTGCNMLTIGQYLRPGRENLPVEDYIHPDIFDQYREVALNMGFRSVASAPLIRSSMNAEELFLHRN